jgi:hypothetical protein
VGNPNSRCGYLQEAAAGGDGLWSVSAAHWSLAYAHLANPPVQIALYQQNRSRACAAVRAFMAVQRTETCDLRSSNLGQPLTSTGPPIYAYSDT